MHVEAALLAAQAGVGPLLVEVRRVARVMAPCGVFDLALRLRATDAICTPYSRYLTPRR